MALSVYVHVPFCLTRCPYCAFYSGEPLELLEGFSEWVSREASLRARTDDVSGPAVTVFFGGGTPSLLGAHHVERILEEVDRNWGLERGAEITMEVNPSAHPDLGGFRSAGVNRISVGVQSLDDRFLFALGRTHGVKDVATTLEKARECGFANVGADLLYGLSGLQVEMLRAWIEQLAELGVSHVSAYCLEAHPGTPLANRIEAGEFRLASSEEEQEQWLALVDQLESAGYLIYEVSNFARPGFCCRHNRVYWDRLPYLGLGPGAHGFRPEGGPWGTRCWNDPGLDAYANELEKGSLPNGGSERLSRREALMEDLFLALRRPEPIDSASFAAAYGLASRTLEPLLEALTEKKLLRRNPSGTYAPLLETMRRADGLALWLHERLLRE